MKTEPTEESYWQRREFIQAFAEMTNLGVNEAREQWAGFSRQLSDKEIEAIELGGEEAGYREGARFNECFPFD